MEGGTIREAEEDGSARLRHSLMDHSPAPRPARESLPIAVFNMCKTWGTK